MSEQFETFLREQMQFPYMKNLQDFIRNERLTKEIYPSSKLVTNALKTCDYNSLKVVILGNEPYNTPSTDMGIAFSSIGQITPRELLEIQREIRRDLYPYPFATDCTLFKTNNLMQWVEQDVLLINRLWTSEQGKIEQHKNRGWEEFTSALIQMLNDHHYRLVFMLWGEKNFDYGKYINQEKHLVLKAHLPGTGKFYGCGHFSKCNEFILQTVNEFGWMRGPINWHLLK